MALEYIATAVVNIWLICFPDQYFILLLIQFLEILTFTEFLALTVP